MIRNLFASVIILVASTSAFADRQTEYDNGTSIDQLLSQASESCKGDSGCQEIALAEIMTLTVIDADGVVSIVDINVVATAAIASGISVTNIIKAAVAANIAPTDAITAVTKAAVKAGQDVKAVMAEVVAIPELPIEIAIAATRKGALDGGATQDDVDSAETASVESSSEPTASGSDEGEPENQQQPDQQQDSNEPPPGTEPGSVSPA
jgi:hypothetical protein